MRRDSVVNELKVAADTYVERAAHYSPDEDFAEEGMSMISGFLEDVMGNRSGREESKGFRLPRGVPDDLAVWMKVGDKIARIRTRGWPDPSVSQKEDVDDFMDDVTDLIVFLAMGNALIRSHADGNLAPIAKEWCEEDGEGCACLERPSLGAG